MKSIITILILLSGLEVLCQTDTIKWEFPNAQAITKYELLYSTDASNWIVKKTISIGAGDYAIPEKVTGYWKIRAVGPELYTPITYQSFNAVTITNPVFKTTSLTWTSSGESNMKEYLLEKTRNGVTTRVTSIPAKGSGNYNYRMNATIYKYTYKATPIYKDGSPGTVAIFK